jgi:tetratricopeptide (TPR) repeat protein
MLLEVELAQSPEASRALEVEFLELSTIHKQKRLSALCIALSARLPSASPEDRLSRTDRALTIDPDCSIAHMNRAESLEILQKDAAALKEWKAASDSVHAPALALSLHARALAKRGRDRAAVALYRQLTSRNHDDFEAIYNLGTLLLTRLNESREAYKWLTLALKKSPADYDVVFNLAVAALRTDHIEEAEGLLDQAKRIRPNDPEVHFNLALLYADYRRQPQAAIQCFQTYLALGGQEKLRVNRWMKELGGDGDDKQK